MTRQNALLDALRGLSGAFQQPRGVWEGVHGFVAF